MKKTFIESIKNVDKSTWDDLVSSDYPFFETFFLAVFGRE
ncbi:MAG: hypothetical protein Ct9H300mP3_11040 [Gammaproteobacteria bacterium]|nr:MAG: hypothetical protein Ct9H300mP3_11040 [Gammaproteobacteria bacterium]